MAYVFITPYTFRLFHLFWARKWIADSAEAPIRSLSWSYVFSLKVDSNAEAALNGANTARNGEFECSIAPCKQK